MRLISQLYAFNKICERMSLYTIVLHGHKNNSESYLERFKLKTQFYLKQLNANFRQNRL